MASKICLNCALSHLYIEILLYQIGTACITLGRGTLHFLRSCVEILVLFTSPNGPLTSTTT